MPTVQEKWARGRKTKVQIWKQDPAAARNANNELPANTPPILVRECWAVVTPLSGREAWFALQVQPDVSHEVLIRWFPDMPSARPADKGANPKMWLTVRGRTLNIESVVDAEEERRRFLRIMAKEEVA